MSTGRIRSKTGCLTCKNRRKKCDEKRPICERCIKAGMECLGYSYLEEGDDKPNRPTRVKPIPRPAKSTSAIAAPSRRPNAKSPSTPAVLSTFSPTTPQLGSPPQQMLVPRTRGSWSGLAPHFPGDPICGSGIPNAPLDFSFLADPTSNLFDAQDVASGWWDTTTVPSSAQQPNQQNNLISGPQSYEHPSTSLLHLSESSGMGLNPLRPSGAPSNDPSMTSGQASLLQALFSLGDSYDSSPFSNSASQTPPSSHGSTWPSPDTDQNDEESGTSEESDPEGVREIVCRTPTLDKNAPSNSLPFVLHSYSRWITWTVFEPLRMASKARDYLTRRFTQSEDSRWAVTLIANVMRTLSKRSTIPTDVLPAIALLRSRAQRNMALVSNRQSLIQPNSREALDALDDMFELITVQFMSSSLASNMSLIREAAPLYRRACSDAPGAPINLPAKLLHPEFSLRHFPALDILFSLGMCIPTQFRYDVSYTPELCDSITDVEDVGLQWMHGVPDQFLVLLARMHMIRADCAPNLDPQTEEDIQEEIKNFRPVVGTSSDPLLLIIRLGVQEAWRQTLYIYLYMGLCGADASDSRVEKALKGFIRLLDGTKPGRTPDSFLILPMIAAGVASRRPQDRETIRKRMTNLRESQQPGTCGYETVLTLNELWTRVDLEGRPAVWTDLCIAVAVTCGIM